MTRLYSLFSSAVNHRAVEGSAVMKNQLHRHPRRELISINRSRTPNSREDPDDDSDNSLNEEDDC